MALANAPRNVVEHLVPTNLFPMPCTAFSGTLKGIKNAIGSVIWFSVAGLWRNCDRAIRVLGFASNFCTSPVALSM